ncbi:hypothetical protein F511_36148 [Dorcoceras hygrometricum]|uniref:Uncharacterized protein n=1 Tax=Dorcoceras hygrometricum TaxID=472368 RepID=A0A2Z7C6N4_9LAMI|nr:hypothetical protein F511_36148 [Dorcoceras hygrometricum]
MHRMFDMSPCWRLGAWLRPDSQGIWHFKVGDGKSPQSGPRLDARLLRQSVLEELMNFHGRNLLNKVIGTSPITASGGGRRPVSMTFRVVRTNQYNQDLGLIHSTNGNHLESPNGGSSIDHQQEDFALLFQQTKLQCPVATQRYPVAKQSAVVVKSSRKLCISSRLGSQAQRIEEGAKCSSRGDNSAAKQLTTCSKIFVNC